MQLTKAQNLKAVLGAATCSLLSLTASQASQLPNFNNWQLDTAVLYYGETSRVQATEGLINALGQFGESSLNLKFVVDSLTGASANGAVAQPTVQTFTTTSGRTKQAANDHHIPLDDSFKDTRAQVSAQWQQPLARTIQLSIGGNFSKESDYLSIGANSNIAFDFNNKNTTLSFGLAAAYDKITPHGGIHKPLSVQSQGTSVVTSENEEGYGEIDYNDIEVGSSPDTIIASSDTKNTTDVLIGLTQVLTKRLIMQFNYSYSQVSGYQSDPYKIISDIDSQGISQQHLYENRPDNRKKHSYYWQTKYAFDTSVVDFSYRYMKDDWQIKSNTFDLHYHMPINSKSFIEPHVRYYQQNEASFYRPYLNQGEAVPEFVSADYRLGKMDAYTVGVKYGVALNHGHQLALRAEYYHQNVKNPGFDTPGVLADYNTFRGVNAVILQMSYRF